MKRRCEIVVRLMRRGNGFLRFRDVEIERFKTFQRLIIVDHIRNALNFMKALIGAQNLYEPF